MKTGEKIVLNSVTLIGRLASDPVTEYSADGEGLKKVARYRLAVERDYRTEDGERPTDFFLCKASGAPAHYAEEHFRKGDTVAVHGRLYSYRYKKPGEDGEHYYVTVRVAHHYLIKSPSGTDGGNVPDSGTRNTEHGIYAGYFGPPYGDA